MLRKFGSFIDRRRFLRLSAFAGVVAAAGCGGGDSAAPQTVDTPPAEGGNRTKLDRLGKLKAAPPATKKR